MFRPKISQSSILLLQPSHSIPRSWSLNISNMSVPSNPGSHDLSLALLQWVCLHTPLLYTYPFACNHSWCSIQKIFRKIVFVFSSPYLKSFSNFLLFLGYLIKANEIQHNLVYIPLPDQVQVHFQLFSHFICPLAILTCFRSMEMLLPANAEPSYMGFSSAGN